MYRINAQIGFGCCTAISLAMMFVVSATAAPPTPIAYTGQQVPGADPGVLYGTFSGTYTSPQINNAGEVMFTGRLTGAGVDETNDGGLWIAGTDASSVMLVGRQGDQAPGAPTGVIYGPEAFVTRAPRSLSQKNITDGGQALFWAELAGSGVDELNNAALFTGTSATEMEIIARTGDQAAGMADGVVYSHLFRFAPAINEHGQVSFSGQVTGPGITHLINDDVAWTGTTEAIDVIAQAGEAAPGTSENFIAHYSEGFITSIDDEGGVQLRSWLTKNGTTELEGQGVWFGDAADNLSLLARSGDTAGTFQMGGPLLRPTTRTGTFAVRSSISGPGVNPSNNGVIWLGDSGGDLDIVARMGDPNLPGGSDEFYSHYLIGNPVLNESGTFAFISQWDHIDDGFQPALGVIMGTSADDLSLVVGGDNFVTDIDPAARISQVLGMAINEVGQIAVSGSLSEPIAGQRLGYAIWGFDPSGGMKRLFQTGDLLEVAPGDVRTINKVTFSGHGSSLSDGSLRSLTDDGQFVFTATFTDGSEGIFVGSLATVVPEPSSLLLSVLAALGLMVKRRRKMPTAQIARRTGLATGLGLLMISPAMGAEFEVVAVTGQQAPGAEPGVLFDSLWGSYHKPRFNAAGQVLLPATLTGTGVSDDNDGGMWVVDTATSSFSLVVRQGDQAPGAAAGVTFGTRAFVDRPHYSGYMGQPSLAFNNAGQLVTWADLTGPGVDATNDSGMWTGTSASGMELLVRAGDQAAGMPDGVVYTNLLRNAPVINSYGQVVLNGRGSGPGVRPTLNEDALWTGTPAGLSLVTRQGDPAPGTTEKFALHKYGGFKAQIDDAGELQIESLLSSNGVFAVNSNAGLWTGSSATNLELFVHRNEPAPGLAAGVVMTSNFHLRPVTSSGQFVFDTRLDGPGVTSENSRSVWLGDTGGDLSLVARRGDPDLPGRGSTLTFEFFEDPVINESGTFAFRTNWDHVSTNLPAVIGIHMGTSADDLVMLAGGDQPIPGLDPDWRIGNIGGLAINNAGQVVFSAYIKESVLSDMSVGQGIWGYDPNVGVELLIKRGDLLEVAPGEFRTVHDVTFTGGSSLADGTPRGLTADGRFMFKADFTDGSEGIFVGGLAVPEPSSMLLAVLATVGMMVKRRRNATTALPA